MQQQAISVQTIRLQVIAALFAVYFFWGGTYLAMKIAIETIPPFLMGGLRFFTAGALVYLWEYRKQSSPPRKSQWLSAAAVSILLLVLSMGGLVWAQQFIPTSIAAIIFATVPFWMALIDWTFYGGKRPKPLVVLGLSVGFGGVILLVNNSVAQDSNIPSNWLGYLVATLAAISWAWGSLCSRTTRLPESPFMSVALQNLTGGAVYFLLSLLLGEWGRFSLGTLSVSSVLSLIYLIIFGSLIGFGAYIWLLKSTDPAIVSTYAYVNPVVAVFPGWLLAGEQLSRADICAAAIILCAVIIITKAQSTAE
jgi:drug/metabolite transporter (DMT)-like permease